MKASDLNSYPFNEWYIRVREYVESTERIHGVLFYYDLVEFSKSTVHDSPEETLVFDILDALCGYCPQNWRIGTHDYDILE